MAKCVNAVSRGLLRLAGIKVNKQASEQAFTKIDLDNLIQSSIESTQDDKEVNEEIKIFQNALYFSEIKVRDCMVPRVDIEAIEDDCPIGELTRRFIDSGYSRILAIPIISLQFFFLMSAYVPEGYSWSDNIIQSVNWIISCFSAIWNGCWLYVINPLISWVTGLDSDCI